jgi:hypothetical protein
MNFDDVPELLTDQAGQLEEYDQRTFKADARIYHQDAWTNKVPRDRAIVTLPALVKEFNAAFGNNEGRKRIRQEYEAAQSKYINEILDAEDLRAYPDPRTCRATKLPCIPNNFFRFFQLFQKFDLDQKHREKCLDREREQVRREMAEMRKALWVYRKHRATNESYEDLQKRADDQFRFYIVSDDEDSSEDDDSSEDEEPPTLKKRKVTTTTIDGSGGGGSSSSSSNVIDLVKQKNQKKKKKKIKKKSTPEEEVCACKNNCGKPAPPALVPCYNKCGRGVKHMCGADYCHEKNVSEQLEKVLSRTCRYCYKDVLGDILVGKYVGWEVEPKKEYIKATVIKRTKKGYEIEFEDEEFANQNLSKSAILQLMEFYDKYLRM